MRATLWLSLAALTVMCTAAFAGDWDWSADPGLQRALFMSSKDPNTAVPIFLHGFWDNLDVHLEYTPADANSLDYFQNKRMDHLTTIHDRGFNFLNTIFLCDVTDPNGCVWNYNENQFVGCHFNRNRDFVEAAYSLGVNVMGEHGWKPKICNPNDWHTRDIAYFSDIPIFGWYVWDDATSCVNTDVGCDPQNPGTPPPGCSAAYYQCWDDRYANVNCRSAAVEAVDPEPYTIAGVGDPALATEMMSDPNMTLDVYVPGVYPPSMYGTGNTNYPSVLVRALAALKPVVCAGEYTRWWPQAVARNPVYQALANGAVGVTHWTLSYYDPSTASMAYDLTDPNDPNSVAALDALTAFRGLTQQFEGALLYGTPQRVAGYDDPDSDPVLATYWTHEQAGADELWIIVVNISSTAQSISVPVPPAYNTHLDEKDVDPSSSLAWTYQSSPSRSYLLSGTLGTYGFYVARFTAHWCLGDMNCDGSVNFKDVNPFVNALSDPVAYAAAHPDCPMVVNGNVNGDLAFNMKDINPFVALLSNPPACD